jgi:hypothetical protein
MEVLYGLPIYGVRGWGSYLKVPFFRVSVKKEDELVVNAYKYLVIRFNQYLILKYGCKVIDYSPTSGMLIVSGFSNENEVYKVYDDFVNEFFIPKLKDLTKNASINDFLNTYYYRKDESGNATGLTDVVIPAKLISEYPKILRSMYKIQGQVLNKLNFLENKLKNLTHSCDNNDLVIVKPSGEVETLNYDLIANVMVGGVGSYGDEGVVSSDTCLYCGWKHKDVLLDCKGKLGPGRMRFRQEEKTKITEKAKICLRCVSTTLFYVLDSSFSSVGSAGDVLLTFKLMRKVNLDSETLNSIYYVLNLLSIHKYGVLILNSLFGDDRVRVRVEGLDELSIERLALLLNVFGQEACSKDFVSDNSSLLIPYISSPDFTPYLVQILKQFKKGGSYMSYVFKYLKTHVYVEPEDKKVAYVLARVVSPVIDMLMKAEGREEDKLYNVRRFAQTLRTSGIAKALAYAIPRLDVKLKMLWIYVDGDEKTYMKEILNKLKIKYDEEGSVIKVDVESLVRSEVLLEKLYSQTIYNDIYTYLVVLHQEIEQETKSEEGSRGGSSAEESQ